MKTNVLSDEKKVSYYLSAYVSALCRKLYIHHLLADRRNVFQFSFYSDLQFRYIGVFRCITILKPLFELNYMVPNMSQVC